MPEKLIFGVEHVLLNPAQNNIFRKICCKKIQPEKETPRVPYMCLECFKIYIRDKGSRTILR